MNNGIIIRFLGKFRFLISFKNLQFRNRNLSCDILENGLADGFLLFRESEQIWNFVVDNAKESG